MTLAQRVQNGPVATTQRRCVVGRLLDHLSTEESEALITMLGDSDWNNLAIERAVREEGHDASDSSIGIHRNERCICYRGAQS